MSKDARKVAGKVIGNEDLELSPAARQQFDQLVTLLAECGFGGDGPSRDTAFAEIEKFGHRAGRMLARAIDTQLVAQHATHFRDEQPCPTCGAKHPPNAELHELRMQTDDGLVALQEPACRCPPCERDFFPGTRAVAD